MVALPLVPLVVTLVAVMASDSPVVPFVYLGALGSFVPAFRVAARLRKRVN